MSDIVKFIKMRRKFVIISQMQEGEEEMRINLIYLEIMQESQRLFGVKNVQETGAQKGYP